MTDPPPLSPQARALLDALKRARTPDHDGSATLVAVRNAIDVGGGPPIEGSKWSGLRVLAAGAGITAAVIGAWIVSTQPSRPVATAPVAGHAPSNGPAAERIDVAPLETTSSITPAPTTRPAPVSSEGEPSGAPTSTRPATPAEFVPNLAPPRRNKRTRTDPPPATKSMPLSDELRLLERARMALARGEFQAVRAALKEHRRRFPEGQLRVEREATQVLIECATGSPGAAEEVDAFLRGHPHSPFRRQIESQCAEVMKRTGGGQGVGHETHAL